MADFFYIVFVPLRVPSKPLPRNLHSAIGKIELETTLGKGSLDDFLANRNGFSQAAIIVRPSEKS